MFTYIIDNFYIIIKKYLPLLFMFLFSCKEQDCKEIVFENYLSTLNNKLYTGKCKSYYVSGKTKSIQLYKDGKDTGIWKFFYENGQIETIGEFIKGYKDGEWKYFYEDGTLKQISIYNFGIKSGIWTRFKPKGEIQWKRLYRADTLHAKLY